MQSSKSLLLWAVLGLSAMIGFVVLARSQHVDRSSPVPTVPVTARGDLAQTEATTIEIFEKAAPSVVYITTLERQRASRFSMNVHEIPKGTGSGFVWDDQGHIVTNFHVVAEGNAFRVSLADQSSYEAKLVGAEPSKDLAVLEVKSAALTPLPVGTSADLRVGPKRVRDRQPVRARPHLDHRSGQRTRARDQGA